MARSSEVESILQKQQGQIDSLRGEIIALRTKIESNSTSTRADFYKRNHIDRVNQANELDDLRKRIRENEAKHDAEIGTIRDEMKHLRSVLSRYEANFGATTNYSSGRDDSASNNEYFDVIESSDENLVLNNIAPVTSDLMEVGSAASGAVRNQITNDSERKESKESINNTMESNPNANTRKTLQVIRRRAGGLISRYVIGSKRSHSNDGLYVSDSFHMYAAATISDRACSPVFGWFVTLIAQLIIVAQVIVLMALVLESSHPTCLSHDDCQIGEFCEWKFWGAGPPRCLDCGTIRDIDVNCSSVIDEINENEYTTYVNKIAWKTDEMYTDSELTCFAQAYCNETNVSMKCEYLQYEGVKCSLTQRLAIIFMSMLFCAPLIGYIQDAIVEEKYLNYALKKYPMTRAMQLAAEMLRIAIRTRQILIPWLGTAAVLSIIIRDPLDIKNLMLNVLAVEVTLIADDLLAIIVLPIFNTDAVVTLARDAKRDGTVESPIWPRILGVGTGIVLITSIFNMEWLIMYFTGNWDNGLCSSIDNMIYAYIVHILPMSAILLRRLGGLLLEKLKKMTWMETTLRFVAKTAMDFFVIFFIRLLSGGVVYQTTLPHVRLKVFYFIDELLLYPSQEIWLSFVLLAVFICGHAIRIHSSWKPFRYLHSNLYGDGEM